MAKDIKYVEFDLWYKNVLVELSILPERQFFHNKIERILTSICCVFTCFPCCIYSSLIRIILCPCTCGSSLGGNSCTQDSDDCILNCCKEIDRKKDFNSKLNLNWIANSNDLYIIEKINKIFEAFKIKFEKVKIYDKYFMCDWLNLQLKIMGYNLHVLPNTAIEIIIALQNRMTPSAPPL